MSPLFRTLVALAGDLGLAPRSHMAAHNHLYVTPAPG